LKSPTDVEVLVVNGSGVTGTGSASNDYLVSVGGPNTLVGLGGNDVYVVNNSGVRVQEGSGADIDIVVATVNFTIPTNVEGLFVNGSGLIGTGSSGNDYLVSLGGPNTLIGSGGNDKFVVHQGRDSGPVSPGVNGNN